MLFPTTLDEVIAAANNSRKLLPVGARTKNALATAGCDEVTYVDMRRYSGIVSYDPSEYLISVRAGTTLQELTLVLLAQGQYLPFDPVFVNRGATIGGTIASGVSGPCRLLYGGLRDFVMEVAAVDSSGREIRGGGKVVKNAAGFDLPKLFVGSYGRLGVLTEVTLKVFPIPAAWITLRAKLGSIVRSIAVAQRVLALPLPTAAIEIESDGEVQIRLAGPPESLERMAERARGCLPPLSQCEFISSVRDENQIWLDRAEFTWAQPLPYLCRVATTMHQISALQVELAGRGEAFRWVFSSGGSVAWIAAADRESVQQLDEILVRQNLQGIVVVGDCGQFVPLGSRQWVSFSERVRSALDQSNKLPAYTL